MLGLRKPLEEENSPPIADVHDSIACSYAKHGMTGEAFESLPKAAAIHNAHDPRGMVRTLLIYAMTYLRAGQPEEALVSLQSAGKQ